MLYTVKMKYFDGKGDCYAVMDGKFPRFDLAWKMVNLLKPENDNTSKFYKMDLVKEDEDNEYYVRTHLTYTTCDGARRALKRSNLIHEGNRRLVLNISWDYDDPEDETHVLIIIEAVANKDF